MFRYLIALGSAFCLAAAPPVQSPRDEILSLRTGQALIVTVDDAGEISIVGIEIAPPLSALDAAAVRDLVANHQGAVGSTAAPVRLELPQPPPLPRDRIRIALVEQGGGKARLLIIQNGYDRGFRYRAALQRGGRSEPTDVCTVLPGIRGYEHWPYKFDRIDLSDLRLVPMREGEPPTCE